MPAVGGMWALAFYLHQRHAEDARFMKELMADFNGRYNSMNDELQSSIANSAAFNEQQRLLFIDYFNLCAEEWIFWKLGYIYKPIWGAWLNGMRQYTRDPRVVELWDEERKSKSYYGLELPVDDDPPE